MESSNPSAENVPHDNTPYIEPDNEPGNESDHGPDHKDDHTEPFYGIVGRSEKIKDVFKLIEKVADSDSTILITGETGTGKGLVAKAIHQNSNRKTKPFVQINCGAIPENLLESELFGHVRGAFTGATAAKPGKFEIANGGTLFLDEIGDMSPDLQVKVLRVLEESEFERVGGCKTLKTDVRIIAATHQDLDAAVEKRTFREDLYYRIYVIPIALSPLAERKSDIPLLVSHFMQECNRHKDKQVTGLSEQATQILIRYSWPGNVRELKNMVERLVVLKGEGEIMAEDLPEKLIRKKMSDRVGLPTIELSDSGICLNTAVCEFEKNLIAQSLNKTKWVKNKAAKLLQLNRTTLVEKIKRYQLQQSSG